MTFSSGKHIVIIGGGFCGIMTAVNLLIKAESPLNITLFNYEYPEGRGIAYKTYTDNHVLNVPCQNMSAFSDQPDHFLNWCKLNSGNAVDIEELPGKFLPRNLYGNYLDSVFQESLKNKSDHVNFRMIKEEVTDIDKIGESYFITSSSGLKIESDKIVLATGNHAPSHPPLAGTEFHSNKRYFANPWKEDSISNIDSTEPILIVGTGLTMVDVVLGLEEKQFSGKIVALSPNGFNILAHKKHHPQRYILDELAPPFDLNKLFKLFYKHVREAHLRGESGETVVDAVRSQTQVIWQQLSLDDKKRFMAHLRHLWGVARHRLPGEIHVKIQSMISNKTLQVMAGRISGIDESSECLEVKIALRGSENSETIKVQRIINCTGPLTDITKFQSKLYSNLLRKKIIRPDEMKLGVDATAEGRIIDERGNESNSIFTLGSLLKGKLWESTAVPELRKQAEILAKLLLTK